MLFNHYIISRNWCSRDHEFSVRDGEESTLVKIFGLYGIISVISDKWNWRKFDSNSVCKIEHCTNKQCREFKVLRAWPPILFSVSVVLIVTKYLLEEVLL